MTLMLHHPPVEVGESLCVMCEACIRASNCAQVPHDHVGMIELF
jgi:TPP-dependent indolepyruvate ferredoxin oxidoreductase alpha subunit